MDNHNLNSNKAVAILIGCISAFIAVLMISSITASKLYEVRVLGMPIGIPVGTSLFALTFLATDVVGEVWGKREAQLLVFWGFAMRVLSVLFIYFAVNVDGAAYWTNQEAYSSVLSSSSRILLAGIITYPISQLTDVAIFHWLKKRHQNKNRLWMRNGLSTFGAQLIDSVCFVLIAFGGVLASPVIINVIIGQVIIKWLIAILDTPFVYLLRNIATGRKWNDFTG